jgi:predicted amidohydrolase YtcJ
MKGSADRVFVNGRVFTGRPARPRAEAVAVREGRIVAVGPGSEIEEAVGAGAEIVDLKGRLLCPGFQDAHVHPITAGLDRHRCNLLEVDDLAGARRAIVAYRDEHPGRAWVRGGGWRFEWFDGGLAPVGLLDELVPDRPAYLRVADGHAGWANSRALQLAGVDANTPDPDDGRIERNPDGSPQGTLQEGAMALVERVLPRNSPAELDAALVVAQDYLFSFGATAWQDAWVTPELHDTYLRAVAAGTLRAHVRGALWWEREQGLDQLEEMEHRRSQSAPRYTAGSVKLMLDGVCENQTARLLDPYVDAAGVPTGNTGLDFIDPERLPEIVTQVMRRGFQHHFHALGDGALRAALDAVEFAHSALGEVDHRPHLAHIQIVHPDDVPRFASLGAVANAQPLWACDDDVMRDLTVPVLGPARSAMQYPFGDLARAGARLAMGSDWAVSSPDVMEQIHVAVTRQVPGAESAPFLPEQRLSLEQALAAFTSGSAYVNFMDDRAGTIEAGKAADLVVLEGDPFEEGSTEGMRVDMTFVDGEVVYER